MKMLQQTGGGVVNGEQLCEASPCYLLLRIRDHLIRMGVPVSTSQLWWVATGCQALPAVTGYSLWLQQASLWVFDPYRVSAEALRKKGWWEFKRNNLQGQTRGWGTWNVVHHCVWVLHSAGPGGHVRRLKVAFSALAYPWLLLLFCPQCVSLFRVQLSYSMHVFKNPSRILGALWKSSQPSCT